MSDLTLFDRVMFEAPEDSPDVPSESNDTPPDMPSAPQESNESLPDLSEDNNDPPPDMMEDDGGDGSQPPDIEDDYEDEEAFLDDESEEDPASGNLRFDEKISAIMNMNLYQRFLSLLNTIGSQVSTIKRNSDMLYTISNNSLDIIESLKKLDENIRLYLSNYFLNENYSKNLLFFNKCLNLLKLLNTVFEKNIQKGVRSIE